MKPIVLYFTVTKNIVRIILIKIFHIGHTSIHPIQFISNSTRLIVKNGHLSIGKSTKTEYNVFLSTGINGVLKIGIRNYFNCNCTITARKSIVIGNNCMFGPNVSIFDHDHKFSKDGVIQGEYVDSPIIIGNGCWIGANVVILRGTVLGDNCVVGAGTVIKGEYPPNSLIRNKQDIITKEIL